MLYGNIDQQRRPEVMPTMWPSRWMIVIKKIVVNEFMFYDG